MIKKTLYQVFQFISLLSLLFHGRHVQDLKRFKRTFCQWCLREKASLGDWSLVCTYKKEGGLGI